MPHVKFDKNAKAKDGETYAKDCPPKHKHAQKGGKSDNTSGGAVNLDTNYGDEEPVAVGSAILNLVDAGSVDGGGAVKYFTIERIILAFIILAVVILILYLIFGKKSKFDGNKVTKQERSDPQSDWILSERISKLKEEQQKLLTV
jgi:hypothetical protein